MAPKFVYFDLGKVLVDFDVWRMYRQVGEVAGIEPERVREVLFEDGLQADVELGEIAGEEFHVGKILVLSGVGAREYYRTESGYTLEGDYMVKEL